MITKSRGDNHRYEFEYPRYSLLHARIEFINAMRACVSEVFEELHKNPLEAYLASHLRKLPTKRRADFWLACGGGPRDLYEGRHDDGFSLSARYQETITLNAHHFFRDWGLDITKDKHIAHFNAQIRPNLTTWIKSLEEWASGYNLAVGWIYHWAFLKLDTYAGRGSRESPIYREWDPPLPDLFGVEVQPPAIHEHYLNRVSQSDFWIEPFIFRADPWRPLIQTASECEERIREDFETALKRYFKDGARYLDLRRDLAKTKEKVGKKHYRWLARYQCDENETMRGLAEKVHQSYEAVRDALHDVAGHIKLPLRKGKAGRRSR